LISPTRYHDLQPKATLAGEPGATPTQPVTPADVPPVEGRRRRSINLQSSHSVGCWQLNLTGWQRGTFVENPHVKRLSLSRPPGSTAKLARRLEAKARVVIGVAINHYESFAICLRQLQGGVNDRGTGPFSLMLGQYSSGG